MQAIFEATTQRLIPPKAQILDNQGGPAKSQAHGLLRPARPPPDGDLTAAGAGEREGWLDDPAVLPSLGPRARALAVASAARSVLVLVPIAGGGGVTVKPALGPDEGRISAVEWIPLAGEGAEGKEGVAVAVGTDAGWLLFYSLAGDLLRKQSIYLAKILKLNFRESKENAWEDSGSDELSVVFPGVIARFDGADLHSMLQKSFQEVKSHMWKHMFEQEDAEDESSFGRAPFQIWNVSKFGSCADTAIVGLMPPPLLELQLLLYCWAVESAPLLCHYSWRGCCSFSI